MTYSKETTKDLINFQTEKYKKIIEQMETCELPKNDIMKDELEDFVNNLQQNSSQNI
jgi:hypothetical protein